MSPKDRPISPWRQTIRRLASRWGQSRRAARWRLMREHLAGDCRSERAGHSSGEGPRAGVPVNSIAVD